MYFTNVIYGMLVYQSVKWMMTGGSLQIIGNLHVEEAFPYGKAISSINFEARTGQQWMVTHAKSLKKNGRMATRAASMTC